MEAKIQISGKGIAKIVGVTCLATGAVALSSLVASGAAVAAVVKSFGSAKNMIKDAIKKEKTADVTVNEDERTETSDSTFQKESSASSAQSAKRWETK